MPERQIAWRRVAEDVDGSLRVETSLRSTRFRIVGSLSGMRLLLRGESNPYSFFGGSTLLRVQARRPLNAKVSLYRNVGLVPLYQRFVRRDVIIGDGEFDRDWIVNAARAAQAQALLLSDYRRLAGELGGDLTKGDDWSMDGRIVVRFAAHGRALTVSPTTVQAGLRQDRLRTRVACDTASQSRHAARDIWPDTDLTALVHEVGPARHAMEASQCVSARYTPMSVWVDLDGHVTDLARLRAAAYLASSLSQGNQGGQGPYR